MNPNLSLFLEQVIEQFSLGDYKILYLQDTLFLHQKINPVKKGDLFVACEELLLYIFCEHHGDPRFSELFKTVKVPNNCDVDLIKDLTFQEVLNLVSYQTKITS